MKANTKAQGTLESLSDITPQEFKLAEQISEFEQSYTRNPRNVFIYAPERVNTGLIGAARGVPTNGVIVPSTPDQIALSHNLSSLKNRRLGNLTGFTLSVSTAFQIRNNFYADTSSGDFKGDLYLIIGTVPYSSEFGIYDRSAINTAQLFYPIFQASLGSIYYYKSDDYFRYDIFNKTYDLFNNLIERPQRSLYRDFTFGDGQITQSDLDLLTSQQQMLAIGLTVDISTLSFANADFITSQNIAGGFPGVSFRLSYAFNYYANLANF